MTLSRKFLIAHFCTFYLLFLIFLIGWWEILILRGMKLSFCSRRDIRNTCRFRFYSPKYIPFNQSYAFIFFFFIFYLFIYLFILFYFFWGYITITESLNFDLCSLAYYFYRFTSFMTSQTMVFFIFNTEIFFHRLAWV